ncbi:PBSX family phage terminase large subunit [Brachybacterium massiliense]|uniref:PBSX family phage terminase large subunit n=1 Tax=Brachybacterium massiliense TaxID=1755098 RepID=UPI000B3BB36D|nr:PBSX family phage terminase large subunit [Brachybacterium massiliense]
MSLSPKQVDSIVECRGARISLWEGAVRSGKTFSAMLAFFDAVAEAPASGLIIVAGRTLQTIERNIIEPMMDAAIFGALAASVTHTRGSSIARILGRDVHLIGAADARAEEKLRGLTACLAMLDEATLVPEAFWNQLLARLSIPGARLLATTNPGSPAHWLKKKFIDRKAALSMVSWRFTLDDNPSLDEDYKTSLKAEQTGVFYRRNINGEWVAAEGSIYEQFDEDRHVIPFAETPQIARVLAAGIDYGTTNPTSALILGLTAEQHPRLVFLDEYRHDPETHGKLTDAEQSRRIRVFLNGRHHPTQALPQPPYTVIDPAAASLKVQLAHDGHRGIWDAANDVLPGIKLMSSLIATDQLLITDRCKGLIGELPGYVWDDKKTEKGEDAPVKANDHSADAARYAIYTTQALWRTALRFTEEVTNAPSQGPGLAAA